MKKIKLNLKPLTIKKDSLFVVVFTVLITLSGWGTLLYQHINSKPNIEGEVIAIALSEVTNNKNWHRYIFSPFLFLTNTRNNAVYIKKIRIEFEYENELVIYNPYYQISSNSMIGISDSIDNFDPTDLGRYSILNQDMIVEFGKPLKGFISFYIEDAIRFQSLRNSDFTVIITDVFGVEYIVEVKDEEMNNVNWDWFARFSGVDLKNVKEINE